MKNLLPLIGLILLCYQSANAQWHGKSCGVQDIELATSDEFDCMWKKAATTVKVGKITCLTGTGIAVIGGIAILASSASSSEDASGYTMIGAAGVTFGLAIAVVSIPIWAVGASRKSKLMESPAYQDFQGASLQISPMIDKNHFTRHASLGLAVSLNF